jgi:hypothetical protein
MRDGNVATIQTPFARVGFDSNRSGIGIRPTHAVRGLQLLRRGHPNWPASAQTPPVAAAPASPAPAVATPPPGQTFAPLPFVHFTNQTLRQIVHTSIGGAKARVLISNAYGTAPVTIGAAHIALRDKEGSIRAASGGALTFSGRPTMTIPAGAIAYSDPMNLTVPAMADLAIDLYLPGNRSGSEGLVFATSLPEQ